MLQYRNTNLYTKCWGQTHSYTHTNIRTLKYSNNKRERERIRIRVLHLHTRCPKNLEIQYQRSYSLFDSNRWQKKMKINLAPQEASMINTACSTFSKIFFRKTRQACHEHQILRLRIFHHFLPSFVVRQTLSNNKKFTVQNSIKSTIIRMIVNISRAPCECCCIHVAVYTLSITRCN